MSLHLAAEFTVDRPTGIGGWLAIIVVLLLVTSILIRGVVSISKSMRERLNPSLYFFIALSVAYLISQVVSQDSNEPLTRTGVDIFPAQDGVDPNGTGDHSHDG